MMTAPAKGRPSKINPEMRVRFLQAIRIGATYDLACKFAGITYQTFLNWKKRAETSTRGPYFDFFEDISKAEGEAAIKWLALLDKHADIDPKWAAWKLERRYPDAYGRQRVDVANAEDAPFVIKLVRDDSFNPAPLIDQDEDGE